VLTGLFFFLKNKAIAAGRHTGNHHAGLCLVAVVFHGKRAIGKSAEAKNDIA
jgi:hypothetical protein